MRKIHSWAITGASLCAIASAEIRAPSPTPTATTGVARVCAADARCEWSASTQVCRDRLGTCLVNPSAVQPLTPSLQVPPLTIEAPVVGAPATCDAICRWDTTTTACLPCRAPITLATSTPTPTPAPPATCTTSADAICAWTSDPPLPSCRRTTTTSYWQGCTFSPTFIDDYTACGPGGSYTYRPPRDPVPVTLKCELPNCQITDRLLAPTMQGGRCMACTETSYQWLRGAPQCATTTSQECSPVDPQRCQWAPLPPR